ncbi:helix-turn-helix domain-containing protein [uncultured Algibacter sp.]|uniref:helix-turn-helix domain-containing protein n=1 Tax=uncultured Algibacter sp. TaxID=298659 RepID=UPI002612A3B9|nr:helix-turn-helix domain-containing protein [uncultured Algibacter sp.]
MNYHETIVSNEQLKDSTLCYWEMNGFIDLEEGIDLRYIPEGQNLLIFNFGNPIELLDTSEKNSFLSSPFFVIPAIASSRLFNQKGKIDLFGISFIADGLFNLIQQPISKLQNSFPINLKDKCEEMYAQMEQMTFTDRSELVESFLIGHIKQNNGNPSFSKAYKMIKEAKGCIKVSDLAKKVYVTERQLQRLFRIRLGISPKDYCKVVRVNSYIDFILNRENLVDWMELVVAFDYHDQPHLINEVKAISKLSPQKLLSYRDTLYDYYA